MLQLLRPTRPTARALRHEDHCATTRAVPTRYNQGEAQAAMKTQHGRKKRNSFIARGRQPSKVVKSTYIRKWECVVKKKKRGLHLVVIGTE